MPTRILLLTLAASILISFGSVLDPPLQPWPSGHALAGDDDDDDDDRVRRYRLRVAPIERPRIRVHPTERPRTSRPRPERRSARAQRTREEIVATGLSADDLNRLASQDFAVVGQQQIGLLGTSLVRLRIPPRRSLRQALSLAAAIAPNATIAPNDLYGQLRSLYRPSGQGCGEQCEAFELTGWTQTIGRCSAGATIGLVD